MNLLAKHHRQQVLNRHGLIVLMARSRWLGNVSGFIGCPEQHGPFDEWWSKIKNLDCAHLDIHTNVEVPGWKAQLISPQDNYNLYFDLSMGEEHLHSQFARSCQKAIRAAIKRGVSFGEASGREELRRFYEIISDVSDNGKKFDIFSWELVKDLVDSSYAKVFVIRADNQVIGGDFVLMSVSSMTGWMGSFERKFSYLAPGPFMTFGLIKWGIANGYRYLDLGQQSLSLNPNITSFKMSFNPLKTPAYLYRVPRSLWKRFSLSVFSGMKKISKRK